ncbi:hypothetical protein [Actinomycetospora callitridis]|uniref:hypothetical protein n=1 Tax=Actinomycetospora callitridis TaxID=913944 RepID=UPI002365BBD3|nr:hypothetical protein [Actinomycetospora callitridis]MDD7916981.1 hypothetical protein [Actinomycetospora callitridis]
MADQDHREEPPSLPETVARERANEEAADADSATSIASTERRGRQATPGSGDDSLPEAEQRERAAAQDADAEQARAENPSIPGEEYRHREGHRED